MLMVLINVATLARDKEGVLKAWRAFQGNTINIFRITNFPFHGVIFLSVALSARQLQDVNMLL